MHFTNIIGNAWIGLLQGFCCHQWRDSPKSEEKSQWQQRDSDHSVACDHGTVSCDYRARVRKEKLFPCPLSHWPSQQAPVVLTRLTSVQLWCANQLVPGKRHWDLKMSRSVHAAGRCSHKEGKEERTEKKRKENRILGPFDPKVHVHVIRKQEKKMALNQQHMFMI